MLQYKTFNVKDEKAINEFLLEWSECIAEDGIKYVGDRVCIIHTVERGEERMKFLLLSSLRQGRMQMLTEAAGNEVNQRFHWGQAARGVKKAEDDVVRECNIRDSKLAQAHYTGQVLELIEKGLWPVEVKDDLEKPNE